MLFGCTSKIDQVSNRCLMVMWWASGLDRVPNNGINVAIIDHVMFPTSTAGDTLGMFPGDMPP